LSGQREANTLQCSDNISRSETRKLAVHAAISIDVRLTDSG
jgi:hypothetical protein